MSWITHYKLIRSACVALELTYDFGQNRTRTERYFPDKFNLEPYNWWLGNNDITEFRTTTIPLKKELSPLPVIIKGDFPDTVKDAKLTMKIWAIDDLDPLVPGAKKRQENPMDIYLSVNCPLETQRASWVCPPYE